MPNQWPRRAARMGLTLAALAAVALFLCATLGARALGIDLRSVDGGSMEPAFGNGALTIAFPARADRLRPGDVITLHDPDTPSRIVTHRIVSVEGDSTDRTFETRGDANAASDPWRVGPGDLIGRVRWHAPQAGAALDHVRSRAGLIVLLLVPGVLLLLSEAPLWYRYLRRRHGVRVDADIEALEIENHTRERLGLPRVATVVALPRRAVRPSLLVLVVATLATGVPVASAAWSYSPPRASDAGDGARVAADAAAVAEGNSHALAVALGGDAPLARAATDATLRDQDAEPAQVQAALRRALDDGANTTEALALIGLDGQVIATTDAQISDVHDSAAFLTALAGGEAAWSKAPAGGQMIDHAVPVVSDDGATLAVLLARSDALRTLSAALPPASDGRRDTIVSGGGLVLSGDGALAEQPWAASDRAVRVDHDGALSVCVTRPIGRDAPLDLGWRVASCVTEPQAALGIHDRWFRLDTFTILALAAAVALFLLRIVARMGETPRQRRKPREGFRAIESRLRMRRESGAP
ncbi:MAG: signal peptidase I [Chloroflexi bacterium]|nr:signal peptidase I [Chloroflexota bacterium]